MVPFFGAIGLVGTVGGIILLITALIKKKEKKTGSIILVVSFILFVAAIALTPTPEERVAENTKVQTSGSIVKPEKAPYYTSQEYIDRISRAFREMGNKTRLSIVSTSLLENNRMAINLSNDVSIYLTISDKDLVEKASLKINPNVLTSDYEDFNFSYLLLVGTVDESLNFGDRNLLVRELGLSDDENFEKDYTKVHINNGIKYTFVGDPKKSYNLLAEFK